MQVLLFIWHLFIFLLLLPLRLLDVLFIGIPRAIIAARWRKRAKVGDRAYFINIMGGRTVGTIQKMDKHGKVHFVTKSFSGGSSQWLPLSSLFPAGSND